jgi:hypothetical protein
MKCENAIQNIDKFFGGWLGELDPETSTHLEACRDCKRHFMAHDKASELIKRIRNFEPTLSDAPGLTDDIMGSLTDPESEKKVKHVTIIHNRIFRFSLSAAAVILFALFGFEQYLVLDKINRLETQYQNVSKENIGGKNSPMYNAWEIRTLKNYNHLKANNKELFQKISSMANNI